MLSIHTLVINRYLDKEITFCDWKVKLTANSMTIGFLILSVMMSLYSIRINTSNTCNIYISKWTTFNMILSIISVLTINRDEKLLSIRLKRMLEHIVQLEHKNESTLLLGINSKLQDYRKRQKMRSETL